MVMVNHERHPLHAVRRTLGTIRWTFRINRRVAIESLPEGIMRLLAFDSPRLLSRLPTACPRNHRPRTRRTAAWAELVPGNELEYLRSQAPPVVSQSRSVAVRNYPPGTPDHWIPTPEGCHWARSPAQT